MCRSSSSKLFVRSFTENNLNQGSKQLTHAFIYILYNKTPVSFRFVISAHWQRPRAHARQAGQTRDPIGHWQPLVK